MNQEADTFQQGRELPWYRQFWPWFLIALPATVVIASFYTLYLAMTHPDPLVIDKHQYRQLDRELKAGRPDGRRLDKAGDPKRSAG